MVYFRFGNKFAFQHHFTYTLASKIGVTLDVWCRINFIRSQNSRNKKKFILDFGIITKRISNYETNYGTKNETKQLKIVLELDHTSSNTFIKRAYKMTNFITMILYEFNNMNTYTTINFIIMAKVH